MYDTFIIPSTMMPEGFEGKSFNGYTKELDNELDIYEVMSDGALIKTNENGSSYFKEDVTVSIGNLGKDGVWHEYIATFRNGYLEKIEQHT